MGIIDSDGHVELPAYFHKEGKHLDVSSVYLARVQMVFGYIAQTGFPCYGRALEFSRSASLSVGGYSIDKSLEALKNYFNIEQKQEEER